MPMAIWCNQMIHVIYFYIPDVNARTNNNDAKDGDDEDAGGDGNKLNE